MRKGIERMTTTEDLLHPGCGTLQGPEAEKRYSKADTFERAEAIDTTALLIKTFVVLSSVGKDVVSVRTVPTPDRSQFFENSTS